MFIKYCDEVGEYTLMVNNFRRHGRHNCYLRIFGENIILLFDAYCNSLVFDNTDETDCIINFIISVSEELFKSNLYLKKPY